MNVVVTVVVLVVALAPGTAMLVGGLLTMRARRRVTRVPVEARLVHRTSFRRPSQVTFDYPAPDGSWLRATRYEGISPVRGPWRWVPGTTVWRPEPGAPMTVWVDPAHPRDVSLGESTSYGGFLSIALVVAGSAFLVFGLSAAVMILG